MSDTPVQSFAVRPDESRGRQYPEATPGEPDPFIVDRRRILRSAAFRRLQYKTQVFVTHENDYYRTRLTHTLEVVDVARRLARMLGVNELLTETIALAHDLGHPPFGHAGEQALTAGMADHGGFEHNVQSLRIIEFLEHPYPPFRGLNLSHEVREGLAKHRTNYDHPAVHELADDTRAPVEGQIACVADRIAYDCHDLEDAIGAHFVNATELQALPLWRDTAEAFADEFRDRPLPAIRRPILDALEQELLVDIVTETRRRIAEADIKTVGDVRHCDYDVVGCSDSTLRKLETLERFLQSRLYQHRRLIRMDNKAKRFIGQLFAAYLDEPKLLPQRFVNRIADQGLYRVVCDYIAGMTDRFCQDEYRRLFLPHERV